MKRKNIGHSSTPAVIGANDQSQSVPPVISSNSAIDKATIVRQQNQARKGFGLHISNETGNMYFRVRIHVLLEWKVYVFCLCFV